MLSNNQLDYIDDLIENAKNSKTVKASKIKEICKDDENDYNEILRMFEDESIMVINDLDNDHDEIEDEDYDDEIVIIDDSTESSETLKEIENEINTSFNDPDDTEQKYGTYVSSVQALFNDVSEFQLLNAEEEAYYSRIVQEGIMAKKKLEACDNLSAIEISNLEYKVEVGEQSKEIMFNSNIKLVISVAKRYMNRGIEMSDAIQEGSIGLLRAIEKFDFSRGFKFSTYAYYWISQSIQRAIADKGRSVRLPVHLVELINRMYAKERILASRLGRDATDEELAEELGITIKKLYEVKNSALKTKNLDAPIGEDGDDTFGDTIKDENVSSALEYTIEEDDKKKIHECINKLTEQEQKVIKLRYGFIDRVHTLQEIADKFGLSRERIRQVQEKAEIKLKQYLNIA